MIKVKGKVYSQFIVDTKQLIDALYKEAITYSKILFEKTNQKNDSILEIIDELKINYEHIHNKATVLHQVPVNGYFNTSELSAFIEGEDIIDALVTSYGSYLGYANQKNIDIEMVNIYTDLLSLKEKYSNFAYNAQKYLDSTEETLKLV